MIGSLRFPLLAFFAVAVACCSILYELLLAQTLATTMGNTTLRYNMTIGLYIASMGVGALFYERLLVFFSKDRSEIILFIKIECLLAVIGLCAPFLVLIFDSYFQQLGLADIINYQGFFSQASLFLFNHSLIVIIGILSGLELPLLMSLAAKMKKNSETKVLMFDYLGTLIGAILFPILLVPHIHLFTMAGLISLINLFAALFFSFVVSSRNKLLVGLIVVLGFVNILYLLNAESFNSFIIEKYYFMGGMF